MFQLGPISPQNMDRKAAADTLCILSSHSSHLVRDRATSIITRLESIRFDKVKPVRDSMTEALQLWKNSTGEDATSEDPKDGKSSESADTEERLDSKRSNAITKKSESVKDASPSSPPTTSDSAPKGKGAIISEKAADLLKKKAPSLTDKELYPEFFQKLETRNSDDLPVELVVPRKYLQTQGGDEPDRDCKVQENQDGSTDRYLNQSQVATNQSSEKTFFNKMQIADDYSRDRWMEQRGFRGRDLKARMGDVDDKNEANQRDSSSGRLNISRSDGQAIGWPFRGSYHN